MKKYQKKTFLLFMLFALWVFLLNAQELEFEIEAEKENLDFEIEEEKENLEFEIEEDTEAQSQAPFFDLFLRNLSGSLISTGASGSYGSRASHSLRLKYAKEFGNWGKLQLTANALSSSISLNLKLKDEVRDRPDYVDNSGDLPERKTISESSNSAEFREAYFDWNIGEYLQLSVGKKLIAFGQFELFSPIDLFSLPTSFSSEGLQFSKLDSRLPQETLQFNIYAGDNTEAQFFYFPKIGKDPLLSKIDDFITKTYDRCVSGETCRSAAEDNIETVSIESVPLENEAQHAARVLFYPSWGIFGLTYHSGYGNFGFIFRDTIAFLRDNSADTADDDYIEERSEFQRREIYGLEFAIPNGSWTWKLEIAYNPSIKNVFDLQTRQIHPVNIASDSIAFDPFEARAYSAKAELDALLQWIRENDNKLNYEGQNIFTALGVDAELELWRLNLVLFLFQVIYDSNTQEGLDLYKAWYEKAEGEILESFDSGAFPSFNVTRYLNRNKTTSFGIIAGIIPTGTGVSVYFNKEYFESLTFLAAFEAISYNGDQLLLISDFDYEPVDEQSAGFRLGVGYKF